MNNNDSRRCCKARCPPRAHPGDLHDYQNQRQQNNIMNSLQYCESIYVLLKLILVIIVDDLEQKQQKNIKTIKQ